MGVGIVRRGMEVIWGGEGGGGRGRPRGRGWDDCNTLHCRFCGAVGV